MLIHLNYTWIMCFIWKFSNVLSLGFMSQNEWLCTDSVLPRLISTYSMYLCNIYLCLSYSQKAWDYANKFQLSSLHPITDPHPPDTQMLRVALSSQKGESATYWYTACNLPYALTPPFFLHLPTAKLGVLIPIPSRYATNKLLYHAQFVLLRDGEQCILRNRWLTKRPKRHHGLIQNLLCMKYYHKKRTFYSFFFTLFNFCISQSTVSHHSNLRLLAYVVWLTDDTWFNLRSDEVKAEKEIKGREEWDYSCRITADSCPSNAKLSLNKHDSGIRLSLDPH